MSVSRISSRSRRLNKTQKLSVAGVSTLAAAAVAFSLVPNDASATTEPQAAAAAAPVAYTGSQTQSLKATGLSQNTTAERLAKTADAAKAKEEAAKKKSAAKAEAKAKAVAEAKSKAAAKAKADAKKRSAKKASRAADRKPVYANNLDGWIREALSIMHEKKIPGTYEGLHRNIIRESSGDPRAINNWDINAINGIPSKGLLQVIKPTFDFYHVKGTKHDQYDPVANITAAANYAADKYGSIDNVDSAY
ncbi:MULTISPECIES: transglycosylase SLT domain-containing protein [Streptomyces]|uniref:Transglycosylase SLT domain-containing protein n=1 Tax=Streptomyces glycanivorans TaxID=3033808 RepID=A0ABY9JHY5_9ACTN|nr:MULTISPECIES: transglycosylase SLT domain-containing protein [unclassified Streptomyces]WSQ80759.1 transglycosylase SLT domain-containing protein [Streptomyces sp. NBC_01213]TXS10101.1 lytic transglycosylase [Streptomyces sp. wa22]WLQ67337.1 transglycosylase SLT domain-containing protein [Streptomyces sp. Alt3]WSQ88091.1 transglycosylase SLT domain-containing protein [Streptomyces sp. NBC_01212]WSR05901.1 transglycosylase SLT domain-containing protein [Streptomyces sp. NBC_01208]